MLIKVFIGRDIGLFGVVIDSYDLGFNVDVIIDSVYKYYKNMWCWKVWVDEFYFVKSSRWIRFSCRMVCIVEGGKGLY